MKLCHNTNVTLLKQSQRSRSVLQDGSRSLGLFWKEKSLSYNRRNTVASFTQVFSLAVADIFIVYKDGICWYLLPHWSLLFMARICFSRKQILFRVAFYDKGDKPGYFKREVNLFSLESFLFSVVSIHLKIGHAGHRKVVCP